MLTQKEITKYSAQMKMSEHDFIEYYEDLVSYGMGHLSDLVPYDTPDYDKQLRLVGENYADAEIKGYPEMKVDEHHIHMIETHCDDLPW